MTADVFGLCFKTGNAVILKGGSDAISSNKAIVESIQRSLESCGLMPNSVQLIEDTSRATTEKFMKMNEYVDLLIPRGGAGLIRTVVENATIPVIETGTGNCHIYVDETADLAMACDIVENAKTQRIGVCNACESLVVHEDIAGAFLPMLEARLRAKTGGDPQRQQSGTVPEGERAGHGGRLGKRVSGPDYLGQDGVGYRRGHPAYQHLQHRALRRDCDHVLRSRETVSGRD